VLCRDCRITVKPADACSLRSGHRRQLDNAKV